jgi:hypothetical protein
MKDTGAASQSSLTALRVVHSHAFGAFTQNTHSARDLAQFRTAAQRIGAGPEFRALFESPRLDIYRKITTVKSPNWFPGPYYIKGLDTNYNYLLIWSDRPPGPDISRQFQLVFARGNAHLWKRIHELGDHSPLELCVPCGDRYPVNRSG